MYAFIFFLIGFSLFEPEADIKLVDFEMSECTELDEELEFQPRIVDSYFRNDTLDMIISSVANCGGIHGISVDMDRDTLSLSYGYGGIKENSTTTINDTTEDFVIIELDCECCFEFTFSITGVDKIPSHVKVNGEEMHYHPEKYKVYPLEFEIMNGDTINRKDKFGRMQGKWIFEKRNMKRFYVNNIAKTTDWKKYHSNGALWFHLIQTDFDVSRGIYYNTEGKVLWDSVSNCSFDLIFKEKTDERLLRK